LVGLSDLRACRNADIGGVAVIDAHPADGHATRNGPAHGDAAVCRPHVGFRIASLYRAILIHADQVDGKATGARAFTAVRNLDIGGDGAQVCAIVVFGDVPDFYGIVVNAVINGNFLGQGLPIEGDARDVSIALGGIKASNHNGQQVGVSVGRVLPLILRVDVVEVAAG